MFKKKKFEKGYNMKFFLRPTKWTLYSKSFFIFQLLSGEVTNLFFCTKFLVVTCRRVVNYVIAADTHMTRKWLFFWKKILKLRFVYILKFSLFPFFRFKCLFLSKFSTVGDGIGLKCLLMAHSTLPWQ